MNEELVQNSLLMDFEVSVDEDDPGDEEEKSDTSRIEDDSDGSWVDESESGEEDNK